MQSYVEKTLELYNKLPQNKDDRMNMLDVRDKIIELNYPFFYYIAIHTYIKNTAVEYEDKLQSCLCHFCNIWWWYKWDGTGDPKCKGYRQNLAFSSFFKPRLSAYIRNELQEVPYTTRRTTLMKIGKILNKKWTQVTLEDLNNIKIDPIDMNIARMVLDPNYRVSYDYHLSVFAPHQVDTSYAIDNPDDYDSLEELLIHETIEKEDKLNTREIKNLANLLGLDSNTLLDLYPKALDMLVARLERKIEEQDDNDLMI